MPSPQVEPARRAPQVLLVINASPYEVDKQLNASTILPRRGSPKRGFRWSS